MPRAAEFLSGAQRNQRQAKTIFRFNDGNDSA